MFNSTEIKANKENTWFTPQSFFKLINGEFDLDPCSVSYRPFNIAKNTVEHDKGGCGLLLDWKNCGRMFINPPYGKEIIPFLDKFLKEKPSGIVLIFARMGNKQIQKLISEGCYAFIMRRRIKFIAKNGDISGNAGTDSMLLFWDKNEIKNIKHEGVFIQSLKDF
jgi:hypothetical protein